MRDSMRRALDFAIAKEREAEAFYKEWAHKVKDPTVRALFAELAGIEYGHLQMLLRITPEEMVAKDHPTDTDGALSEILAEVDASPSINLQEAMIVAMKREEIAFSLYARLAQFGGETQSLFQALAAEERRHKQKIEAEYDQHILSDH